MKVLIKHNGLYKNVYWVKGNSMSVEAYFMNTHDAIRSYGLHETDVNDIHFTYPEDGNIHYSFKQGGEASIRVFKNGWYGITPQPGSSLAFLQNFLPGKKMTPTLIEFAKSQRIFQFAGVSFNMNSIVSGTLGWKALPPKKLNDAIILDSQTYSLENIWISAYLISKSHPLALKVLQKFWTYTRQESLPYADLYLVVSTTTQ